VDLYAGWLDYDPPYRGWVQLTSKRNNIDNYHAAARDRAALVRRQLDGIADKCRRNGCPHPMQEQS
jgi:hypothetical protein